MSLLISTDFFLKQIFYIAIRVIIFIDLGMESEFHSEVNNDENLRLQLLEKIEKNKTMKNKHMSSDDGNPRGALPIPGLHRELTTVEDLLPTVQALLEEGHRPGATGGYNQVTAPPDPNSGWNERQEG